MYLFANQTVSKIDHVSTSKKVAFCATFSARLPQYGTKFPIYRPHLCCWCVERGVFASAKTGVERTGDMYSEVLQLNI